MHILKPLVLGLFLTVVVACEYRLEIDSRPTDEPERIHTGTSGMLLADDAILVANPEGIELYPGKHLDQGDPCLAFKYDNVVAIGSEPDFVLGRIVAQSVAAYDPQSRCPLGTLMLIEESEFRAMMSHYRDYSWRLQGVRERSERLLEQEKSRHEWSEWYQMVNRILQESPGELP